jgi:serine/threonine protein kinase
MALATDILGYDVVGTLGYGARSTIFVVKDKENKLMALKRVIKNTPADQRFLDQAVHEYEVCRRFNHPSLRKSYKLIRRRKLIRTTEVIVLMELVDGLTLEQLRPKRMMHICRIFEDTAIALGVMHRAGWVHADVKPSNILVTGRDMVKIIDLGQSCRSGTRKDRIQGTPDYIAPEQVERRQINPRTDVFNLGATMYWLLTGQHVPTLIPKTKPVTALRESLSCDPPRQINPAVPPALSSLVMQCVESIPRERPASMTEVYERLELAISQVQPSDEPPTGKEMSQLSEASAVIDPGSSIFNASDVVGGIEELDQPGMVVADLLADDADAFDPSQFRADADLDSELDADLGAEPRTPLDFDDEED